MAEWVIVHNLITPLFEPAIKIDERKFLKGSNGVFVVVVVDVVDKEINIFEGKVVDFAVEKENFFWLLVVDVELLDIEDKDVGIEVVDETNDFDIKSVREGFE